MSLVSMMRMTLAVIVFGLAACQGERPMSSVHPVNWEGRMIDQAQADSVETGTTYLSVYSQIYSDTEHRTYDLTATISMRNTSVSDTVYLSRAAYFNTHGALIRTYFNKTIYLAPMETVEIVIDEKDREGGSGANFIFDWYKAPSVSEPLFEAIMISTSSAPGISFMTNGKRVDR